MSLQHLESYLSETQGSQESLRYWEQQILKLNNLSGHTVARVNNVPVTQMNEFVRRPLVTLSMLETSLSFIDQNVMVLNHWKKNGRDFPQLMIGWNNLRQQCAHTLQVSKNDLFKGILNQIGAEKKKVDGIKAGVKAESVGLYMRHLNDLLRDTVHTYQQWQQGKVSITSKGFDVLQKKLYAITTNTLAQAVPSLKSISHNNLLKISEGSSVHLLRLMKLGL